MKFLSIRVAYALLMIAGLNSILPVVARAQSALATEASLAFALDQPPQDVQAIVVFDSVKEASLLQLRGRIGQGRIAVRDEQGHWCEPFPSRLVSGDFEGNSISLSGQQPIVLFVYNRRIAEALAGGDDIVSDSLRVGMAGIDLQSDIEIHSGLTKDTGFVINPGSSFLSDIFGAGVSMSSCTSQKPFP